MRHSVRTYATLHVLTPVPLANSLRKYKTRMSLYRCAQHKNNMLFQNNIILQWYVVVIVIDFSLHVFLLGWKDLFKRYTSM